LIALLLFFYSSNCFSASPSKLDSLSIHQVWLASHVLPGSGQVINKQYWKVPVFYAGMGSMLYLGLQTNKSMQNLQNELNNTTISFSDASIYKERWVSYKVQRNMFYAGVAAFYVASISDALVVRSNEKHSPVTATVLSTIFPGMGQVYNGKLWKVPVVFGTMASLYYIVDFNQRFYKRFGDAYKLYPNDEFKGTRTKKELTYWRDSYRRNRDLAIIGMAGAYILNIIDANVDAHFFDYDISDNLALKLEPTLSSGLSAYSFSPQPVAGFRLNINF
jgi:hypothetical protein